MAAMVKMVSLVYILPQFKKEKECLLCVAHQLLFLSCGINCLLIPLHTAALASFCLCCDDFTLMGLDPPGTGPPKSHSCVRCPAGSLACQLGAL